MKTNTKTRISEREHSLAGLKDFLPALKAPLKFRSSFNKREVVILNDTQIPFINYDDLILDKKANSRSKDITDIEQLNVNRRKNKME